jgi:hypothetical protein
MPAWDNEEHYALSVEWKIEQVYIANGDYQ